MWKCLRWLEVQHSETICSKSNIMYVVLSLRAFSCDDLVSECDRCPSPCTSGFIIVMLSDYQEHLSFSRRLSDPPKKEVKCTQNLSPNVKALCHSFTLSIDATWSLPNCSELEPCTATVFGLATHSMSQDSKHFATCQRTDGFVSGWISYYNKSDRGESGKLCTYVVIKLLPHIWVDPCAEHKGGVFQLQGVRCKAVRVPGFCKS